MVQKKIPLINSAHGSETRNIINELIKLFNQMGYTYDEALQKAHEVLDETQKKSNNVLSEAERVNALNENVQQQIDTLIAESGTSDAEVVQARIDSEGNEYDVLKTRLDEKEQTFSSQFVQTANDFYRFDFDVENARAENANSPLSNQPIIHPSILFFPQKWNGYRYWMAMTPYENQDIKDENPTILVSQDGDEWIEPEGIVNPIYPYNSTGYNADTELFMSKDNKTMYCVWREKVGTSNRVQMLSTTDGVNWGNFRTIIDVPSEDSAVPNVILDGDKYKLFTVDLLIGNNKSLKVYEANNPEDSWVYKETITLDGIPEGRRLWHYHIEKVNNLYIIVYIDASENSTGSARFYLAKSYDLKTWEYSDQLMPLGEDWDRRQYKGTFLPFNKNGEMVLDFWYSGNSGKPNDLTWYLGRTEIKMFTKKEKPIYDYLTFLKNYYPDVILDDFSAKKDGALGFVYPNIIWERIFGDFEIINGTARAVDSGSNNVAVLENEYINGVYELEITNAESGSWLVFAHLNRTTFMRFGIQDIANGRLRLQIVGGSQPKAIDYYLGRFIPKHLNINLKAVVIDGEVKCYFNNEEVIAEEVKLDDYGLKFGIQSSNSVTRFKTINHRYSRTDEKQTLANFRKHYENDVLMAQLGVKKESFADSFGRTSITENAPVEWESITGTMGIQNRIATAISNTNSALRFNTGFDNYRVTVELSSFGINQTVLIACESLANTYRLGNFSGTLTLEKIVGGSRSTLHLFTDLTIGNGDLLGAEIKGDSIKVYLNGRAIGTVVDASIRNSGVGIQSTSSSHGFRSILIEKIN